MVTYIQEILKADNFPNWLNLIAVVLVLLTLNSELSRSEIEELKKQFLIELSKTKLPVSVEKITKDTKSVQAISELVRDGLVLQTAYGYEIRRYDPRLKDDINFATGIVLINHFKEKEKITIPENDCKIIDSYIDESMQIVTKLESMRGGDVGDKFNEYLQGHKDVFIKELFLSWSNYNGNEYATLTKCSF